jgi:hypothetical protein
MNDAEWIVFFFSMLLDAAFFFAILIKYKGANYTYAGLVLI